MAENARALLGVNPEIFPVSSRLALRAKQGDPPRGQASRFEALERYIHETLDAPGRVHLKLLNPLGVGVALTERHATVVRERPALLKDDYATLDDVERQLEVYQEDLGRDFEFRMADIDKILLEMERRGHDYFDETLRIGRVMDLLNRSRIQQGFEQQVVADAPQQIERKVGELVDWLVAADLRQWQAVTTHLSERRRQYRDRIVARGCGPLPLRPDPHDRLGGARGAAGRRLVRSAAGGAADRGQRAQCGGGDGGSRRRRAGARHHRHDRGIDGGRGHHRHRPGVGGRGDWILHPAREAAEGERGDAEEDRRRPRSGCRTR